jgi:gliding motility-associated-like protein
MHLCILLIYFEFIHLKKLLFMSFRKHLYSLTVCLLLYSGVEAQVLAKKNSLKQMPAGWVNSSSNFPGNIQAFEENQGQWQNPLNAWNVYYACNSGGTMIYFTDKGVIYRMAVEKKEDKDDKDDKRSEEEKENGETPVFQHVGVEWIGANAGARIESVEETPFYFASSDLNNPTVGHHHIKSFKKLIYHDLYPGIDVTFTFHPEKGIKYTLQVKPGTDASVFRMRYTGIEGLKIDRKGNLDVKNAAGVMVDHAPVTTLLSGETISSSFVLRTNNEVGFQTDKKYTGQGMVIDPWVLPALTVVPAKFVPTFTGMDAANNVYITGIDAGTKFCYTQKYLAGTGALSWTYTYNVEYPAAAWVAGMAVDPAGNTYVGDPKGSPKNAAGGYYKMVCLNTAGALVYYNQSYAIVDIYETLTLAFDCAAQVIVEAGSRFKGMAGNVSYASVMTAATGNVGNVSSDTLTGEVYGGCVAPNGNYYCLAVDSNQNGGTGANVTAGAFNNLRCYSIAGATITPLWKLPAGYSLIDYVAKSGPKSLSLNSVAASCAFLYTTDGITVDQRSLTTGVISKSAPVPGGITTLGNRNGGIAVDLKCGYVYVGGVNNVYVFDANLNPIFTYSGLPGIVYDVRYNNGFVAFTGATAGNAAFVAQYPAQTCPQVLTHVNPSCANNDGTATANPTFCAAPYTYLWTPSGQTTATATGLAAGLYTVQIGSGSACVTVTDTVTLKSPGAGTETIAGTNPKCAGQANGTATVTMTGGTGPFTYTWSPAPGGGQGTVTATGLGAGTYTCSVTGGGCTTTQTVTLTSPAPIAAPNTPTNVTCNGGSNGAITVTPSGGTPGYTYSWTPAPAAGTAATVTGLPVGTYTCYITDATGCVKNDTVKITQPVAVTATATTAAALCGTANGSATATGANGVGAYTYSWNPSGQTTQTATGLAAGTYTCTVTDANGCSGKVVATVPTTGGPSVTAAPPTNITCNGACNGALSVTASGGVAPYTYSWSPAPGAGQTTNSVSALCPGTYTCQVTDSQGCATLDTVTVVQPPALLATTTPTNVVCFGQNNGSILGTSGGGTAGYTYAWAPAPAAGQTTLNATALTAGTYTLTVTDSKGCSIQSTATVAQPALLTVNATGIAATCNGKCNGQIIGLPTGGTAAYTYSWNGGCSSASCNAVCAGTYTATITDSHGCVATDTALVKQPTPIVLSMTPKPSHCSKPDGSDSVSASGGTPGYTYSWTPGANTTAFYNHILAGTYTVHVKDNNGCLDSSTNTVTNLPGVNIVNVALTNVSCNGGTNGTARDSASGGFKPYTYSWTPAPGTGQGTNSVGGLAAGVYTCTVTDSASCSNSVTVTIGQPPPLTVLAGPNTTICIGQCTDLTATAGGGTPAYTYSWVQNGALLPSTHVCPTTSPTTYTVVSIDSHGCISAPSMTTVILNPPLEAVASADKSICPGASATLQGSASGGNGGPYTYLWIPATGLSSTTIPNPVATPSVTTTYTVIVADNCGTPTDSAMTTVTLYPNPVAIFTASDTVGCAPICINFTGKSVPACASATWNFGDNSPLGTGCGNVRHCYAAAGTYNVTYNVIDVDGCKGTYTQSNFVNALPRPEAAFSASPQPTTILDPNIHFTDQSTSATPITWAWTFGDVGNATSTLQNPKFSYPDTGCYNVLLIVTSANGCTDSILKPVCIRPEFTFYAPNTFTPNGDGKNDVWMPYGIGIDINNYDLIMFDRWGNLMFETHTWGEGWDGRANHGANIAQIDTYVWKVSLKDVFGIKHNYIGHCNIIK